MKLQRKNQPDPGVRASMQIPAAIVRIPADGIAAAAPTP
jgi:hypothetical protein